MTYRLLTFTVLSLALALTGGSIAIAQAPVGEPLGDVRVLAHRGASAYAPEHTFFAYDLAMESDTDFLECDLQLTADEILVCVHNSTVDRTSDGSGDVEEMTLADLRALDWGSWFNEGNAEQAEERYVRAQVVPFEEQLDCYRAYNPNIRFHIETKSPESTMGRMEEELIAVLAARGMVPEEGPNPQEDLAIVQSFSLASLELTKQLEPRLTTAYLYAAPGQESGYTPAEVAAGTAPEAADVISPFFANLLADPTYATRFHANGVEVHTYTVDDPEVMDALLEQGVDAIFTNVPDVLRERIDARGSGVPAEERGNPETVDPLCPGVAGTYERDAVAESLRASGRTFSASGPAQIADAGPYAYAPDVLLARQDVFADALAASGAQGLLGAPLLLTDGATLDGRVRAELVRLGAQRIGILGGPDAISDDVVDALTDDSFDVVRMGGDDRVSTAVAVADAVAPDATLAVLARSDGPGTAAFVDALTGGSAAAALGAPVLLTETAALSAATAEWLTDSDVTQVLVAGGEKAVSEEVLTELEDMGIQVTRAGGATRFDTAVALAQAAGLDDPDTVVIVDGTADDAWVAGFTAASGAIDQATVVLGVDGSGIPDPVADFLQDTGAAVVCAYGVAPAACEAATNIAG